MSQKKKGVPGGSPYPTQTQAAYPSAPPAYSSSGNYPAFPQQTPTNYGQGGAAGGAWGQPPPPYSAAPAYPPAAGGPPISQYPGQYPAGSVTIGPGTEVHIPGVFNAGARFDGHAQARIPPPPPGVAPNLAQIAAMSGARVVTSKQKNDKWGGGAGGGAVFW